MASNMSISNIQGFTTPIFNREFIGILLAFVEPPFLFVGLAANSLCLYGLGANDT